MRQLPPLHMRDKYYKNIEKEINRLFYETIYRPLLRVLKLSKGELKNALSTPLSRAIVKETVTYNGFAFRGVFSASMSKELRALGAVYNKTQSAWMFSGVLPDGIVMAIASSSVQYKGLALRIESTLNGISSDSIGNISEITDGYIDTISNIDKDFVKNVKKITIAPNLTQEGRNVIAAEWAQNMDLYIKTWTDNNIKELRSIVERNTIAGGRSTDLVKLIQDNYGTSRAKAKFLAKQETSLLMSKFREERYKSIGITKYRWSISNIRTRPDHKDLDGKVFTWDNPPITNKKTGARNNAGEDFGCNCVAVPLVE